jgi:hypothetical protein
VNAVWGEVNVGDLASEGGVSARLMRNPFRGEGGKGTWWFLRGANERICVRD